MSSGAQAALARYVRVWDPNMGRLQRFLATPYKARALRAHLLGDLTRALVRRRLARVRPETLPRRLRVEGDPAAYFRSRRQPKFFFDSGRIPAIIAATPPKDREATVREARGYRAHTFAFRSLPPVTFTSEIDWGCVAGDDPDWNADLHRLDWLITMLLATHHTGDTAFAEHAASLVVQWWRSNPPGSIAWRDPFEVAQRGNTLAWIFFLAGPIPAFSDEAVKALLCAIWASGCWTEATLEYHIPNNHLLVETARLAELGLLFPELPESQRWLRLGLAQLEREIGRQVLPDGVHAERSVFYQRIVLEVLLELALLMERNAVPPSSPLRDRIVKMLAFLASVRRPDGEFPLLGDGFRSDIYLRYNLLAVGAEIFGTESEGENPDIRTLWLLNGRWPAVWAPPRPSSAGLWADGGYAIFRRREPDGVRHLIFDCGEFGMAAAPGHGHSDCLSVEISAHSLPFVVDPGSYSWFRGESDRNAFRSTRAHNTLVVDGADQTPLYGIYDTGRFARPAIKNVFLGEQFRLVQACHDGYARLAGTVVHCRAVLEISRDGWLIMDRLAGLGSHLIEVLWHFHPRVSVRPVGSGAYASYEDGRGIHFAWIADGPLQADIRQGDDGSAVGWVGLEAGEKKAADTLVLCGRIGLPAWVLTFVSPRSHPADPPKLHPLSCQAGVAVVCERETGTTTAFFGHERAGQASFGQWATDAEIAVIHEENGEKHVMLVGGSALDRDHRPYLRLPGPTRGMALTWAGDEVHLSGDASFPLVLAGDSVQRAFWNGKILTVTKDESRITLSL